MFNVKLRKGVVSLFWHRTSSYSENVRPMEITVLCGPLNLYSSGNMERLNLELTGGSHLSHIVAAGVKISPSRRECADSF